jgi:quinol monooxygenase YgiN
MIIFAVMASVIHQKRTEFMQTATDMIDSIPKEKGNMSARLYQDVKDEHSLFILTEWKTEEDLDGYVQSDHFKVLQWVVSEMSRSSAVRFSRTEDHQGVALEAK